MSAERVDAVMIGDTAYDMAMAVSAGVRAPVACADRRADLRRGMEQTLERVRSLVEESEPAG